MDTLSREELNKRVRLYTVVQGWPSVPHPSPSQAHLLAERAQLFTSALDTLSHSGQPPTVADRDAEAELRRQNLDLRAQIDQVSTCGDCNESAVYVCSWVAVAGQGGLHRVSRDPMPRC